MTIAQAKQLLLVEDDAIITLAEKEDLEKYGYRVTTVSSGEKAVELILEKRATIDLILMDIDLGPGMDGTEAAKIILQNVDIPILFLSHHTEPEIVAKTEEISSYGYVTKQSTITVLDASIKMAFKLFESKIAELERKALRDDGSNEDITERKKTDHEHQESKELFFNLFNFAPIGLAISSLKDGRYYAVNEEVLRQYGASREDMIGKSALDMGIWMHPESRAHIISLISTQGFVRNMEIEMRMSDGGTIPMLFSAQTININDETYMLSAALDIQKLKNAENEIIKELKEKEIILKEVHHRIKNNINSIESLLRLQLREISNTEAKEIINSTISRVESMHQLYQQLLLQDQYAVMHIKKYLENLIKAVTSLFPDNIEISIQLSIDEGISLNPKKTFALGTIINELINNSSKYAFKNLQKGTISVTLQKENSSLTLTVEDNGCGLPQDFTIEKSSSLGLILVKMLSQQLQGTFSLTGEKGTKAIISFEI